MALPNFTHISPLKNWNPLLPPRLKPFDGNNDGRINPSELTDKATEAIVNLTHEDLETFFYNSTSTLSSLLKKMESKNPIRDKLLELEGQRKKLLLSASQSISQSDQSLFEFVTDSLFDEKLVLWLQTIKILSTTYWGFTLVQSAERFVYQPDSKFLESPGYEAVIHHMKRKIQGMPGILSNVLGLPEAEIREAQKHIIVAVGDWTTQDQTRFEPEADDICNDETHTYFNGISLILMNNCHHFLSHNHLEDIEHEYTHAVLDQLLGLNLFSPAVEKDKQPKWIKYSIPNWLGEGIATYVQENLDERIIERFCKEGDLALVTGKCTINYNANPKTPNDMAVNDMINQRDCIKVNHDDPVKCLTKNLDLDYFEHYSFYGAAMVWLGRSNIHFLAQKLYEGEFYQEVITETVSHRLNRPIENYKTAKTLLEAHAVVEMVKRLENYTGRDY